MLDTARAFYATWENWLLAAAIFVCLLFMLQSAREMREPKPPAGYKPMFPDMIRYYGAVYVLHKTPPGDYLPKYLAYYSVFVMAMGVLEWIVEGNIGLLVRLEIWGIAGAFISASVFSHIGAWVGVVCTWFILSRNRNVSAAGVATGWVMGCSLIGASIGVFGGMAFFCYVIAILNNLNLWVVVVASSVPTLIVFLELMLKARSIHKANKFSHKSHPGVILVGSHCDYVEEQHVFPSAVVPQDPNWFMDHVKGISKRPEWQHSTSASRKRKKSLTLRLCLAAHRGYRWLRHRARESR